MLYDKESNNLKWFIRYLSGRKQYIEHKEI